MIPENPILVYLIAGFLGAGKTTLLGNLLELSTDKKIGVIVNEFGKMGIDGTLIKKDGLELIEISNGSIFCSCLQGSFMEGLVALSNMPIEYLFIESSGLSDPSGMEKILYDIQPATARVYDYKGALCIVDATNFIELFETLQAVGRQVVYSHLVIINKADLTDSKRLFEVEAKVRQLNPFASIVTTSYAKLDTIWLGKNLKDFPQPPATINLNRPSTRPKTLLLEAEGVFEKDKLKGFLTLFLGCTFRIKGFVMLKEGYHYIDGVADELTISPTNAKGGNLKLIVILKTKEPMAGKIRGLWAKYFDNRLCIS